MKLSTALVTCVIILSGLTASRATTLTVCTTCPATTIRAAIAQAAAGDTVLVRAGFYQEGNLVIDKPLTLRGIGYPVVDGQLTEETFTIAADDVTLEGFKIQNAGHNQLKDLAAIRVQRKKGYIIRNNLIINSFFGIYLEYSGQGLVIGNTISGQATNEMSAGNAIHAWYTKEVVIRDNLLQGHRDGIYLEFVTHSTIHDNRSTGNIRYGLHYMFSNDDAYFCNTFDHNGAGVAVMFSKRITMTDNVFEYNWGRAAYGLLLKEINDADILRNRFTHNTMGICLEGTTRIRYTDNTFSGNGWALQLSGGCDDNVFTRNNFLNNALDLVVNGRLNNNLFAHNYWREYSGYDLDRDGIGDVPYRPVKLFSHILTLAPEAIVLLRSLFTDLLNFSEKVNPLYTPNNILDNQPLMQLIPHD
ncbi:MAG: nitrous oxide reductase family maturation protein NosD [Bacteroidetes bacterium]|nr:MAG: nitrous oxide reductase family maturation protein NosD [Bacteroidota bacterium]PTM10061.1 MAG: nitrous oxide reductase family maturation protein NosD [Bacteroidota bacterium]